MSRCLRKLPACSPHLHLLEDLKAFDTDFDAASPAHTLDKAHGRLEERACSLVPLDVLSDGLSPLPGRRQALRSVRLRGRFQSLPQAQRHYAARQGEVLRQVTRAT